MSKFSIAGDMDVRFKPAVELAAWVGSHPVLDAEQLLGKHDMDETASDLETIGEELDRRDRLYFMIMDAVVLGEDGKCMCSCATKCPLHKTGIEERCTEEQLVSSGITVIRPGKNIPH